MCWVFAAVHGERNKLATGDEAEAGPAACWRRCFDGSCLREGFAAERCSQLLGVWHIAIEVVLGGVEVPPCPRIEAIERTSNRTSGGGVGVAAAEAGTTAQAGVAANKEDDGETESGLDISSVAGVGGNDEATGTGVDAFGASASGRRSKFSIILSCLLMRVSMWRRQSIKTAFAWAICASSIFASSD